jgi:hypothetical protein
VAFEFDADGRHRRSFDTLTGIELARFDYDGSGRLDASLDGRLTTFLPTVDER